MFGYVRPCKAQMRVCEYETYKAIYCGLCKQLGQEYGPFTRLTLSYDFTFLAILQMSLSDNPTNFSPQHCICNPLKKNPICNKNEALSFSAGTAMILGYYKVLDNYQDGDWKNSIIALLCMPIAKHAYKGAVERYPEIAQIAYETISRQSEIESEKCDSIDIACEPTAQALSGIFKLLNNEQERVLERFGYLLGRYIYMADALDDLEEDLHQNSYNPFLIHNNITVLSQEALIQVRENAKGSLFLTMGELEKTFGLLKINKFEPILENIIHLGLHETVGRILLPKEIKANDRSL